MNRKIKNAEKYKYGDITFRSKLEKDAYILLSEEEDFMVEYEKVTYVLMEGFRPTTPFYRSTKSTPFRNDAKKVIEITYTPDFTVCYKNVFAIIEIKGFPNDVYPVKRKLFRRLLDVAVSKEDDTVDYMFFEIKTMRELRKAIQIIKDGEKIS